MRFVVLAHDPVHHRQDSGGFFVGYVAGPGRLELLVDDPASGGDDFSSGVGDLEECRPSVLGVREAAPYPSVSSRSITFVVPRLDRIKRLATLDMRGGVSAIGEALWKV